ncbi:MAG TPA: branched-chain amino acid ABC transporter substrate-binding protein [Mycobacteriales bacterium]|jgi:branched-chain amino acid transport system substrate-binding protein|nr:branched-chain amino acid ABC transporter substrate-binding protein [Mycobacteriales bacterium]
MQTGRSIRLVVPLAVAAVTAAGCGSSSSGGSSGSTTSSKSYTIACQGPLTGDNAALGINICDGAKLAIDQANAKGDLPYTLKYLGVDDQGSPDKAPAASQSEVSNSSVVAVVGPAFSGATQASEKNFADAGLVSVTASATLPTLTDAANGFTTFYRAIGTDSSQGAGAADYLTKKLGAKSVYSIDDAEAYGQGLAKVLEGALKSAGVSVTHDSLPQGTKPGPEASKVAQANPDAVYYSGYYADGGPLLKALRSAGYKGTFMSDDGVKDPNFIKLAGAANAEGTYFTCPCSDPSKAADFFTAYKAAFNQEAGTYSAEAYDVANAIITAMKGLGSDITRSALASAVADVNYDGITKTVAFGSDHELKSTTVYLYQVENGAIKYLGAIDDLI